MNLDLDEQESLDQVLANNLDELKELHQREMLALNILNERKREMQLQALEKAFDDRRDEITLGVLEEDLDARELEELNAIETERVAARKELEVALGQFEADVMAAEAQRQNLVESGQGGEALQAELDRLKAEHDKNWAELNDDIDAERRKRREALLARLERKKAKIKDKMEKSGASEEDIGLALEALEADTERQLSQLEFEILQRGQDLLMRERQREALADGRSHDDEGDGEDEFRKRAFGDLKAQQENRREALRKALDAEQNRRKAKVREKVLARKRARKKRLQEQGKSDDDPEMVEVMEALETEEAAALADVEAQIGHELEFYSAELDRALEAKHERNHDFHGKLADLNKAHADACAALRRDLKDELDEGKKALQRRLQERRAARAKELLESDATAAEIEVELELLNEDDTRQMKALKRDNQAKLLSALNGVHSTHDNDVKVAPSQPRPITR